MCEILPNGIMVYAENPGPLRFIDISLVIKPADRTAYVLKKVASVFGTRNPDSGKLIYHEDEFMKYASHDLYMEKRNAIRKLAELEKTWWQAHHRRNKELLLSAMGELYELLFDLPAEVARQVVQCRVEATQQHDIAEDLEDRKDPASEEAWQSVETLLVKHFLLLLQNQAA